MAPVELNDEIDGQIRHFIHPNASGLQHSSVGHVV
jgi:hypothetical protein